MLVLVDDENRENEGGLVVAIAVGHHSATGGFQDVSLRSSRRKT
jgi:hypothetical protein